MDEEARRRLAAVEGEAVAAGWIVPVGDDVDERRYWCACELASLVEGCFDRQVEPRELDGERALPWIERLRGMFVVHDLDAWRDPIEPERRCWIVDDGRRVGTIKLGVSRFRGPWLFVHSLYVLPNERRRGIAGRRLEALARLAVRHELVGIRLATYWTWQRSLRFYLARDFWVSMWKHDIQLVLEPRRPRRRASIDGETAHLDIVEGDEVRRVLTARRAGDLLMLDAGADVDVDLQHLARGTFAVLLALAGWPLVRSEDHWASRYGWSDAGDPEGLAYKIGVFENVAHDHGWTVNTVKIPGLDRWQAWARGEEHGRDTQVLRDIDTILSERGWRLDDAWRERIRDLDRYFELEHLLRRAVTADSFDAWVATANELLERGRNRK